MANIPQAGALFVARSIEEVFPYQNILLYADAGAGKTWLAASAVFVPEMCDVLFISLESGEASLREIARECRKRNIPINRILVIPVQTYKQFSQIYEMLRIHINARDKNDIVTLRRLEAQIKGMNTSQLKDEDLAELIPEPLKFQTVVVDSLTEAQKYCMYQILGIDPLKQKLDEEPDAAQFQDQLVHSCERLSAVC